MEDWFSWKRPPCEVVQDIEKYQQQLPEDSRSAFWQGRPHDQHHKPNKNEFVPSSKCGESRGCVYAIGYGESEQMREHENVIDCCLSLEHDEEKEGEESGTNSHMRFLTE